MDTNRYFDHGLGSDIIDMHRAVGIKAETLTGPDDPRLWSEERDEDLQLGGLFAYVRLRKADYATLKRWMRGFGLGDVLFVHEGNPAVSPIVVLPLIAYQHLLRIRNREE